MGSQQSKSADCTFHEGHWRAEFYNNKKEDYAEDLELNLSQILHSF